MNVEEFERWYDETNIERQKALYEMADREVNGSDEYYERPGRLVEEHPIASAGIRGSRAC